MDKTLSQEIAKQYLPEYIEAEKEEEDRLLEGPGQF
jgi:hypothetical protein